MSDNRGPDNLSRLAERRDVARKGSRAAFEQNRKALLEAAMSIFQREGYEAASIATIAKAAGMDRGSVYYYTPGKRELFSAIVLDTVREIVATAEEISRSDDRQDEKLRNVIRAALDAYAASYPVVFIYLQEDMGQLKGKLGALDKKMLRYGKRYERALTKIIADGVTDGEFRDVGSPKMLAFAIMGMINWTHRWFQPSGQYSPAEIAAIFSELAVNGLASD